MALIGSAGAFIVLRLSIYGFVMTFNASSAAKSVGRASLRSFSQSNLITLALSTASYTVASSILIPSASLSAMAFSLATTSILSLVSSAAFLSYGTMSLSYNCIYPTACSVLII